jgi:rhomboid family GlyGly-CTERM serine protease
VVALTDSWPALRYERSLLGGEPWRLLTGHFTHLGWTHLALNLAGLAAVWALLGALLRPTAWLAVLLGCALGVSCGLYFLDPGLAWYVGLSGVLHGMFVGGALAGLGRARLFHALLLVGVVAKVAYEQVAGADVGSAELVGGAVVVNSHLYGVLAGFACLPIAWRGRTSPDASTP